MRNGKFLSHQEKAFVEEYLKNGMNGTAAVKKVYGVESDNYGSTKAERLLRNPRINNYMIKRNEELGELAISMGITPEYLLGNYKKAIDKAAENIDAGKRLKSQSDVIKDMGSEIKDMTGWRQPKQLDVAASDTTSDNLVTAKIADFKETYLTINNEDESNK